MDIDLDVYLQQLREVVPTLGTPEEVAYIMHRIDEMERVWEEIKGTFDKPTS